MDPFKFLPRLGSHPDDDETTVSRKRFLDYGAWGSSVGALLFGGLLLPFSPTVSCVLLGFLLLVVFNMLVYARSRNFFVAKHIQTGFSLVGMLVVQGFLGGYEASGGIMWWSMVGMLLSLPFLDPKESRIWALVYVLLCAATLALDGYFSTRYAGTVPLHYRFAFQACTVIGVVSLVSLMFVVFIRINTSAMEQVRQTLKQLLLSEKLAALGQLSAGIAHEVNSPLSAIQSTTEESSHAFAELLADLRWMARNLNEAEKTLFLEFVTGVELNANALSTREEREIKKRIRTRLEVLGNANAALLSDRLVQMGIHDTSPELEQLAARPDSERLLRMAYNLLHQHRNNQTIQLAVQKASKVMQALKTYLHTSTSNTMEALDIRENVETVLTIYHNRLKHGIQVVRNYEAVPEVMGHPDQLLQVWTNLIVNAAQAMSEQGTLTIAIRPDGNYVLVSIQDTGTGIPDKVKARIFEPFFTTKAAGEGSGIGLDLVHRILKDHEAILSFDSTEGVGTTFYVRLPTKKST